MNLSKVSINRPVFAIMLLLFFVTIGLVAQSKLNIDMFPDVSFPIVTVVTRYPGAAPDEIETLISKRIEDAVSSISGIEEISSQSYESFSVVMVRFILEKDVSDAAQEVREKVSLITNEFPDEAHDPEVSRMDFNAQPVVYYGITSESMSEVELRDWVDKKVKTELERVDGVSRVQITGGAEREIRVDLDKAKIEGLGISPQSIQNVLRLTNFDYPAGSISEGGQDLTLKMRSQFSHLDDLKDTLIPFKGGMIRLSEIADIYDGSKEQDTIARVNGVPAIAVAVSKQSGTNTVAVADNIVKKIDKMRTSLPSGIKIELIFDDSVFIRGSIHDIYLTIVIATVMATFVVLLFLGSGKSTLAISLSIPISVITTFALYNWAGFTINFMSLMALAVAVGLVVDDAIIVAENIYRHLEMKKKPLVAALDGAREITGAVMAATLSIVAVFLPIGFMQGIIGRFFREFGLGVAFSMVISIIVALTLIPVMLGYLYPSTMTHEELVKRRFFLAKWFDKIYEPLENWFVRATRWVLTYRKTIFKFRKLEIGPTGRSVVIVSTTLAFVISLGLATKLNSGFIPLIDSGVIIITAELPPDSGLEETDKVVKVIESRLEGLEDVLAVYAGAGDTSQGVVEKNKGFVRLRFTPKEERDKSTFLISAELQNTLADIPGAKIIVKASSGGDDQAAFRVRVVNPDKESLTTASEMLLAKLTEIEGTIDEDVSTKKGKVEISFNPDMNRVADLGLTPVGFASQLSGYIEGFYLGPYRERGEEYDITMYISSSSVDMIEKLKNLQVWSPALFQFVSLSQITDFKIGSGSVKTERYNRTRSTELTSNIDPLSPRGVGDIRRDFLKAKRELQLPSGTEIVFTGETEHMMTMMEQLGTALILAIIFTYMVLASQFNSLVHPFNIMLTVPLAIIGAILAALMTGTSFNLMSFIGIIMLTGLVTKNAILLIDFTNQRIAQGMPRIDALVAAARIRLRPIIMTSLTMIVGLIPVAIGFGEGGGFRAPMGIAIIGGITLSTFLAMFVIPVMYVVSDDITNRIMKRKPSEAHKEVRFFDTTDEKSTM